jgi:Tol biopolymer transport system component
LDVTASHQESPVDQAVTDGRFQSPFADEPSNLNTIRPDGTDLRQLTTYPRAGERAVHPTFTPDGERIIVTHVRRDATHGRWPDAAFIDTDGSDLQILSGPAPRRPRLRSTSGVP